MKILLVEDEKILSEVIASGFKKIGYAVDSAFDGEEALYYYEINEYDAIILDLFIPKIDGYKVLQSIREKDISTKILILTAKNEIENKIKGFDLGANDYLTKPFDFLELQARINALLRRNFNLSPSVMTYGNLELDTAKKELKYCGKSISLTKKEYGILEYLLLHKDTVVRTETLIEHIWDSDADLFSNSIKFHISSLRKKIREATDESDIIETVRGEGYIIRDARNEE